MRTLGPILLLLASFSTPLIGQAGGGAERAPASRAPRITTAEIDGHLRFLSSDLLEGRAPATRGGRLAAEYIASQLRVAGLQPGADGSYFQKVPIDIVAADSTTIRVSASGKATANLRYPAAVVVWAGSAAEQSGARGELVFVGYGAHAPEYRWDDFKDVDVKGKVLLVLVNDPPAPASEPRLFGGKAMTYYGRWTYKFEEAERRGAAGMLIVHTTERAGYPWHTVVGSWAKEQRILPRDSVLPPPIGVQGWITDSAATALLRQAGLDMAQLKRQAEGRSFRPVPTGIIIDASFRNSVQHLESDNVIGIVRGRDASMRDEWVAFSSHWDHLGIGPKVDGDSIYNGALDNASGVADMLAAARLAAHSSPSRSLIFVFVTAEESGLLGSKYFAENPTVPVEKIIANVNVDGGNLLGRSRDFRVLGSEKSSLGPSFARLISTRALRISPDEHPERGYFYRSDHFSFAKVGIPSVSIASGNDYVGKAPEWGRQQSEDYTAHRYHQPSDEYRPDFDLSGAVQLAELVVSFGLQLANNPERPRWNPDAEFAGVRAAVP
ncbi:MAG TPA: M28 family peptidase [Gemmatimonadaceae bacterium]|nr:M28 family peptidase [Gemmatimonadaceae bacterium]